MHDAGVVIDQPMDAVEVMGIVEVLGALGDVRSAMNRLVRLAAERRPSAAILTDFADFNLRLARHLKDMGIPVVYFISPKVWAWRGRRVKTIRKLVDMMLLILPFEEDFYARSGMSRVKYVGNPLVDELAPLMQRAEADVRSELGVGDDARVIGLLPGSRPGEIRRHARLFAEGALAAAERLSASVFAAPPEGGKARALADTLSGLPVRIVPGKSRELLRIAHAAVIKSGTGTLEAAILGAPAIVVYKANPVSFLLASALADVRYAALPNLIAGREVYPELLQWIKPGDIAEKLVEVWDGEKRSAMLNGLASIRDRLGPPGSLNRAAQAVLDFLDVLPA